MTLFTPSSTRAVVWLVILAALCAFSGLQVVRHWKLQTDILALLPNSEQDPAMRALRQVVSSALGRTALFLVGHKTPEAARTVTEQLGPWMAASPHFDTVQWNYRHQQQAIYDLYFPLRYRVLSPTIRGYLNAPDGAQTLLQRVQQTLYQPTSAFATRFLETDPLLFFPALAQHWGQQITQLHLQDGLLTRQYDGRTYHVITAQIAFNPFDALGQTQFLDQWTRWAETLRQTHPDLDLTYTSFARFAAATRHAIRRDIELISILSMVGVVVLTVSTFRTLTHLLLALTPLVAGIWSAIGLTLFWFGELHALTLAFGASLIGICIDYKYLTIYSGTFWLLISLGISWLIPEKMVQNFRPGT